MNVSRLVIFGVSSQLGMRVARRALVDGVAVAGTYRTPSPKLDALAAEAGRGPGALELSRLDVSDPDATAAYCRSAVRLVEDGGPLGVVYSCGAWRWGAVRSVEAGVLDECLAVGLRGPFVVTSELLRHCPGPSRMVIVTGLGGERSAVARNAIYSICTNGVYSLVRAVGMEAAGTPFVCTGVALGLYDKGQDGIDELCANLNIGRPGDLDEAASFIVRVLDEPGTALNGAVVELGHGLSSYFEMLRVLSKEDRRS